MFELIGIMAVTVLGMFGSYIGFGILACTYYIVREFLRKRLVLGLSYDEHEASMNLLHTSYSIRKIHGLSGKNWCLVFMRVKKKK